MKMDRRGIASVLRVLDEELLAGDTSDDLMRAALRTVAASSFAGHLSRCGLNTSYTVPGAVDERLLRLRLLFCDEPDPTPSLLAKMTAMCSVYRLVHACLQSADGFRALESEVRKPVRSCGSDDLRLMVFRLIYALAMMDDATKESAISTTCDVAIEAMALLARLRQHWESMVGGSVYGAYSTCTEEPS